MSDPKAETDYTLTDDERESLRFLAANRSAFAMTDAFEAVERIVAARLAPVVALADDWERRHAAGHTRPEWISVSRRLRNALGGEV